jgi:zinc protease
MMKEFAKDGPSDEELSTAKKQIANSLVSQMKEPSFWLAQLEDIAYRGRPLADIKQLPEIYQTFTAEQVRDVARKYIKDERVIRLAVIPDEASTTSKSPATKSGAATPAAK